MTDIFVTTFNKKLLKSYAHKLIDSYNKTKQKLPLYVFVEDDIKGYEDTNKIKYLNIFEQDEGEELKKFIIRNKGRAVKDFFRDAIRFSYKVFAQNAGRKYGDRIFYIDSDSVFIKQIPDDWYNKALPKDKFLAFYDRPAQYTETGFLAFDNTKEISPFFFERYLSYYIKDTVYDLNAFTDCHTLDGSRTFLKIDKRYSENKLGDGRSGHIMARCKLINPYIDHRKGNRKEFNNSPEWEQNRR